MRNTAIAILTSVALLISGCAKSLPNDIDYNFVIILNEDFIKQKAPYNWSPFEQKKSSEKRRSSTDRSRLPGELGLVIVAAAIAFALVYVPSATAIHNIKGTNVDVVIEGAEEHEKYELQWGINKFLISEKTLSSLEKGTARMKVIAKGTRKLEMDVPIEGMKIKRDVHIMEFTGDGRIVVDGMKIPSS